MSECVTPKAELARKLDDVLEKLGVDAQKSRCVILGIETSQKD